MTAAPTTKHKPDEDNSKDFVEHLRTVHFALLTTSLAMLVIVVAPSSDKFANAFRQLDAISDTSAAMTDDWVREGRTAFLSRNEDCIKEANDGWLPLAPRPVDLSLVLVAPLSVDNKEIDSAPWLSEDFRHLKEKPRTLGEFRQLWDARFRFVCADILEEKGTFIKKKTTAELLLGVTYRGELGTFIVKNTPELNFDQEGYSIVKWDSSRQQYLVKQAIATSIEETLMRNLIRQNLPDKHLPYREFKDAFYDLDQATAGVQDDASFTLVRKILELQQKNSTEVFEAFGQKFPVEAAARWGILIILGIQYYFWLHFAEYRNRRFRQSSSAWVGAYTTPAARFLFGSTAFIAPVSVVAFVCMKAGLLRHEMVIRNIVLCAAAVLISALFSLLTARQYFQKQEPVAVETMTKVATP